MPKEGPKDGVVAVPGSAADGKTADGQKAYNPVLMPLEQRLDATVGKAAH